jgi:DNA-binding LacI/PurR family transcriptional regulator
MGHDAIDILVGQIAGADEGDVHVTLGTTLVVRGSTAAPRRTP